MWTCKDEIMREDESLLSIFRIIAVRSDKSLIWQNHRPRHLVKMHYIECTNGGDMWT